MFRRFRKITNLVERLKGAILSIVQRSYRPWRDAAICWRYPEPVSPRYGGEEAGSASVGSPPIPPAPEPCRLLFPQNPETPHTSQSLTRSCSEACLTETSRSPLFLSSVR